MNENSSLLKVSSEGKLLTLDIKNENGQIIISSKEWEEAIRYSFTLSIVNDVYLNFLKSIDRLN
ncbi:MAG: hypothetical protein AAFY41_03965 [Bacteroidota bacterium]